MIPVLVNCRNLNVKCLCASIVISRGECIHLSVDQMTSLGCQFLATGNKKLIQLLNFSFYVRCIRLLKMPLPSIDTLSVLTCDMI